MASGYNYSQTIADLGRQIEGITQGSPAQTSLPTVNTDGEVHLQFDGSLSAQQKFDIDTIFSERGLTYQGRDKRTIWAIKTDLVALTAGQKTAIWNDLNSGSPTKLQDYHGHYEGVLASLKFLADSVAGLSGAEKNDAKALATAMYAQDHPSYLVNPAFDPTISVSGREADV